MEIRSRIEDLMEKKNQIWLPYRVVMEAGEGEIIEKKSRFIANIAPAEREEEAAAFLEALRKKYYDARHHCSAFIIGRNSEITRCSDDGEPSGTAGKPMLEVLSKEGLTNTVLVVTRYFGGTLLGTGGLVRAYTDAAIAAVKNATIVTMRYGVLMTVQAEYTELGKLQYLLAGEEIPILKSDYTDKVILTVQIPYEKQEKIRKALMESTAGKVTLEVLEEGYFH